MKPEIAVIARVGAHKAFEAAGLKPEKTEVLSTPYGDSRPVHFFRHEGLEFAVLSRHGEAGYELSAPFINPRANLYALKSLGVAKILAWVAPGSLRQETGPRGSGGARGMSWMKDRAAPIPFLPGWAGALSGITRCSVPELREALLQGPGRGALHGPQPRGLCGHHRAAAGDGRGDPQVPPPGGRPGGPDPGAGGLSGPGAGTLLRLPSLTW